MNSFPASGFKKAFERMGHVGPIPFLTKAECQLLQNYIRSGEVRKPMAWGKGLAPCDRLVHGLATRSELLKWLAELLGPHVYLWGAQVIAKKAGEAHPWHTDIETSAPHGRFVSVWIGIENTSAESALQYISGSHRIGKPLQQVAEERQVARPDRTPERALAWAKDIIADADLVVGDVRDGDAILFDGRIWHGSLNVSGRPRHALLLQYAAADQRVRIPDLAKTYNWPFAYRTEVPPAVTVLGRARGYPNLVELAHRRNLLEQPVLKPVKAVPDGKPWTPQSVMDGRTAAVAKLGVHFSLLQPGHSPHAPHAHVDEEILIVIDGEAEVVLPNSADDPAPTIERLYPGDFTYYPSHRWHTIRNASASPVLYLMLKWNGASLGMPSHAPGGVFRDDTHSRRVGKPFETKFIFEGATHFLKKVHVHRSMLLSGGGYAEHADPYDVMIVLLEGMVHTMGRTIEAPAFLYHPAETLHGIRARGRARYLVIEMHGGEEADRKGRTRKRTQWSTTDEFTYIPGQNWKAWRVS